jgi:sulfur-oxidizing protein SoxX
MLMLLVAVGMPAAAADAAKGKEIVVGREANCLLCHEIPDSPVRVMGNVGPSLARIGMRRTTDQLRRRVVDSQAINPESVMPAYGRSEGFQRVAKEFAGKPVLTPQQIEDVVAYLETLQ